MAYCDIPFADQYFNAAAFTSGWDALDSDSKRKYIESASRIIRRFCCFYDENDGMPFRYSLDALENEIPDFLREATCEQALYLVNLGKDPTQADKKTTLGIASADGTIFDKSFAADVLCIVSQNIIIENGGDVTYGAMNSGINFGRLDK